MALATIDSVLGQIDDLVRNAGDSDGMGFRLRLEELIKKGGRDTENAIHHYITGTYVGIATRINLVRMAGYIRSDAFLLPLKKVIDTGEDDLLREEAILSVAKYGDHRALDILASALEKSRKPQLQEAITRAIGRIKENNPFLVMLPRFLSGSKNRDLFLVTLKVFKKILSPADAKTLIAYLHHGDQLVGEGSFEILCFRGDEAVYFFVAEYFREHGRLLLRGAESQVGASRLAVLTAALHEYLKRYPQFFLQLRADIADMQAKAGGAAWGGALAALLADLDPVAGAE
jgi:hypothetical protein